jgi:4-aminobutyrate aminotransferase-like enzyme
VHNVGRNHPAVKQAMIDFLKEDYPTMVAFDAPLLAGVLAKELKARVNVGSGAGAHDLEYVFFTNSGTEGVEAAIKFAKCATQRPAIVYTKKAFHGLSGGSLSINGDESFRAHRNRIDLQIIGSRPDLVIVLQSQAYRVFNCEYLLRPCLG